jgi:dTDP-4-dehydrorhamnose reductase
MKNIIIFGSNGMLGNYLYTYFKRKQSYNVVGLKRPEFEINDKSLESLENFLESYTIGVDTCIINCIGLIPQRGVTDYRDYYMINAIFPQKLQKICKKWGAKYIHPTTDCVFSGAKGGYVETDTHDETNHYGTSKSLGELGCYGTIIRCSIIGEEQQNKKSLLEWVKNSKGSISGWDNHMWNGVTCLQYCKIVEKIIEDGHFWNGVRHLYSPGALSKYDLVCAINDTFQLGLDVKKVSAQTHVDKTLSTVYSALNGMFAIPPLEEQIAELPGFFSCIKGLDGLDGSVYCGQEPYPHGFLDGFLEDGFAKALQHEILSLSDSAWDRYNNPFEQKYTLRDKYNFPPLLRRLFAKFESPEFVDRLSEICGYKLLLDETRNFWGVHKYKPGDYLDIHVDAGIHPIMQKKKQLTLGLYLSAQWKEEYGCKLELWKGDNAVLNDAKIYEKVVEIAPLFNRLILFTCNDYAWHGNPEPSCGPEGSWRIFITLSYMSENTEDQNTRMKAFFVARPEDPVNEEKDRLRLLRADPEKYKEVYNMAKI